MDIAKIPKEKVLVNPVRLAVLLYLFPRDWVLFSELSETLQITPENLDSHLRVLCRERYVEIRHVFRGRPRVVVRLTDAGARKTMEFLRTLKKMV